MAADNHSSLILNTVWEKGLNPVLKTADALGHSFFIPNEHWQNPIIPALHCMVHSNNQRYLRPVRIGPSKCRSIEPVIFFRPYIQSSQKGKHYHYYHPCCCSVFSGGPVPKFWRVFIRRAIHISFCCITSYHDTCPVHVFKSEKCQKLTGLVKKSSYQHLNFRLPDCFSFFRQHN